MICTRLVIAALAVAVVGTATVQAQPAPEPSGPHPRILLDDGLRAAWKAAAKDKGGAVHRAITRCEDTRTKPAEHKRDSYMGFDWASNVSACLIAWVARGSDEDARSAIVYFKALLDDQQELGDGKGGEKTVRRDTGYPTRSIPPFAALAYDWLYDHPLMTAELKGKARERFVQWLSWYKKGGYHNRLTGTNYHAGYVFAATFVALAMGGDGEPFNQELWAHVRDDLWGVDMAKSVGPRGTLDGGDFPEGWQYASLSVAEYALTYRAILRHGVTVPGMDKWLEAMLVRTVHGRSGARDDVAVGGDTQVETPSIAVHHLTLASVLIGPTSEVAQRQAAGEIQRLGLKPGTENLIFAAVAQATKVEPAAPALDKWPLAYFAPGTTSLYARTSWGKDQVWMTTMCKSLQPHDDHQQPNAGNLIVTRGTDEVIVDPSPYGSLSTLTTNAPTVRSKQLPDKYQPSQAYWGETAHFVWAQQTASGVVAARCDYADQYKFKDTASDIPLALRDIVMIPWNNGADATFVVVDRAETAGADSPMNLRFRSPSAFTLEGGVARAKVGASTITIRKVAGDGTPEVRAIKVDECWDEKVTTRGGCDAARFPVGEYRLIVPGGKPEATHVIDVAGAPDLTVTPLPGGVVHLRRGKEEAYIAPRPGAYTTAVPGGRAIHVVLADGTQPATLAVTKAVDRCAIDVKAEGAPREAAPLVFAVDASCAAKDEARTGPAAPPLSGSGAALIPVGGVPQRHNKKGGGCCGAGGPAGSSMAFAVVVLGTLRRRRRAR